MPIDSNLLLQFRPPQVDSPVNALAQVMPLVAMQRQNALGNIEMQKAQQDYADTNAFRDAIRGGADPSTPEGVRALTQASPLKAQAFMKSQADLQRAAAETRLANSHAGEFDASATQKALDAQRGMLTMVQNPQQFATWVDNNYANPATAKLFASLGTPEEIKARIPQDPAQFQQFMQKNAMGMDKFIADQTSRSNNAATNATHVQTTAMTNNTSIANTKAHIGAQYAVAGLNQDGSPRQLPMAVDGSLDLTKVAPEDLAAAHRYRTDGTLPANMGRGLQGAAESKKIRAIATALDLQAGESPEDARIRQLAMKGDVGAIAAMRKREVAVGANVKNFDFNSDQVLQLSGKVDRTGVPMVNAWLNAGKRAVTGNPELAAFDVAVKTTVNEFAQIVSGTTAGATTEGEKKKAEALLNAQQTPEGIASVINQMRIESKNRMQSFVDQRKQSMPTMAPASVAPVAAPAAGLSIATPDGQTHTFPNAAALAAFKKAAGL